MFNKKSKYSQVFNSDCKNWFESEDCNLLYLRATEQYFNDVLRERGYVFLRDILEYLGFPVTRESLFVGWLYDPSRKFADNHIEFGLSNTNRGNTDIKMNFNVNGDITICLFKD